LFSTKKYMRFLFYGTRCIWPSWSNCHSLSLASVKSRLVLPLWYRLTWVVPENGPSKACSSTINTRHLFFCYYKKTLTIATFIIPVKSFVNRYGFFPQHCRDWLVFCCKDTVNSRLFNNSNHTTKYQLFKATFPPSIWGLHQDLLPVSDISK